MNPSYIPNSRSQVLHTEVIDGKTYYVLSDMPANWPPAPPHFIAGKKLRWEGTRLMERTDEGEQAIFRFDATIRGLYLDPPLDRSRFVFSSDGLTAYLYMAYPDLRISNLFRSPIPHPNDGGRQPSRRWKPV